jgi:O-antigen/teichoic acid export membrane protein
MSDDYLSRQSLILQHECRASLLTDLDPQKENPHSSGSTLLLQAARRVATLLGGSGLAMGLGFLALALNARALGIHDLGVLAVYQAAGALISGWLSLGMQHPLIRFGKESLDNGDYSNLKLVVSISFYTDWFVALAGALACLAVFSLFHEHIEIDAVLLSSTLIWLLPVATSGIASAIGAFRLLGRFDLLSLSQLVQPLIWVAASTILYVGDKPLPYYVGALAIVMFLQNITVISVSLFLLHSRNTGLVKLSEIVNHQNLLRSSVKYGATSQVATFMNGFRSGGDILILNAVSTPTQVAMYTVARQYAAVLNKLSSSLSSVMFPEAVALYNRGDFDVAQNVLSRFIRYSLGIGILAIATAGILGDFLYDVSLGEDTKGGNVVLPLQMAAAVIFMSGSIFGGFVQAFHGPRKLIQVYAISLVLFIVAAAPLSYLLGAAGAAIAQAIFAASVWISSSWTLRPILRKRG